jgi:hypothetical protein
MSQRVQKGLSQLKATAGAAAAAIGAEIGQFTAPKMPASIRDLMGDEDEEGGDPDEDGEEENTDDFVRVTQEGVGRGYGSDDGGNADADEEDDGEIVEFEDAGDLASMVAAEKRREAAAAGRLKKTQKRRKVSGVHHSPAVQTGAPRGSNPPGGAWEPRRPQGD